jgi:hypothetical protein
VRTAQERASLCVGLSIFVMFVVCLKMETPVERTVAFTVVPFAFIAITFWDRFLRSRTPRLFRPFATSAVLVAVLTFSVHSLRTFHFRPIEAWRATARTIENHFPKGTEIVVQFRPQWLKAYLSADYPLTPNLDAPKFLAGEQIVVDPSFDPKAHFPVRDLPKGYLMKAVPQRRGGMQKIYFAPR